MHAGMDTGIPNNHTTKCTRCGGVSPFVGYINCPDCKGQKKVNCSLCSGTSKIEHSTCDGEGHLTVWQNCQNHDLKEEHYYCTSGSRHGNNVGQYHK